MCAGVWSTQRLTPTSQLSTSISPFTVSVTVSIDSTFQLSALAATMLMPLIILGLMHFLLNPNSEIGIDHLSPLFFVNSSASKSGRLICFVSPACSSNARLPLESASGRLEVKAMMYSLRTQPVQMLRIKCTCPTDTGYLL